MPVDDLNTVVIAKFLLILGRRTYLPRSEVVPLCAEVNADLQWTESVHVHDFAAALLGVPVSEAAVAVLAVRASMLDGPEKENLLVILNAGHGDGNNVPFKPPEEAFDTQDQLALQPVVDLSYLRAFCSGSGRRKPPVADMVTPGDGIQRCNTDVFPVPTVSEPDLRAPADERPFGAAAQADEKQRTLEVDNQRLAKEEAEIMAIATDAERDLAKAMPALDAAVDALEKLDKKSIAEVKAYAKPPELVMKTMNAVMTVMEKPATWASAKNELQDVNFLQKLKTFKKDEISNATLKKIEKYTKDSTFQPQTVQNVSKAAGALW